MNLKPITVTELKEAGECFDIVLFMGENRLSEITLTEINKEFGPMRVLEVMERINVEGARQFARKYVADLLEPFTPYLSDDIAALAKVVEMLPEKEHAVSVLAQTEQKAEKLEDELGRTVNDLEARIKESAARLIKGGVSVSFSKAVRLAMDAAAKGQAFIRTQVAHPHADDKLLTIYNNEVNTTRNNMRTDLLTMLTAAGFVDENWKAAVAPETAHG